MPVVGSSVVIKVLRRSCQIILTVTDLIIDGWLLGFADWPHPTVPCNAPRMVDPLPLTSSALPLSPLGSSQTALSASQACSMLMQCDHFQPSTSLCHVKGIYIQHYQCGTAVLTSVLSAHHPRSPAMGRSPLRHQRSLMIYFSDSFARDSGCWWQTSKIMQKKKQK